MNRVDPTEPALPEIERAFSIQPGDRIILEVPADTTAEAVQRAMDQLKARWADIEFLVIAGARVAAVGRAPLP